MRVPWFEPDFGKGDGSRLEEREEMEARMDTGLDPYAACERRATVVVQLEEVARAARARGGELVEFAARQLDLTLAERPPQLGRVRDEGRQLRLGPGHHAGRARDQG